MARVTPQQYSEKWGRRLKQSLQDVQAGVQGVTEAPTAAAARALDRAAIAYQEAISSGRTARKLNAVSLSDWQSSMVNKGIPRISAGVDQAASKQVQMAERLLAAVDSAKAKVDAMPKGTLADSISRMTAFATDMATKKGQI